jgi:hypothetical protein
MGPAQAPAPATRVASAAPAQSDGFFSSLAKKVGLGTADTTASAPPPSPPAKPKGTEIKPPRPEATIPKATAPKPDTKQAAARPALKPSISDAPAPAAAPPAKDGLVAGSAPIVSANSFESRFGAIK